jgi:hypothetical protein
MLTPVHLLCLLLVFVIAFLPNHSVAASRAMGWWWFRTAALFATVWLSTRVHSGLGLLAAVLYVRASDANHTGDGASAGADADADADADAATRGK